MAVSVDWTGWSRVNADLGCCYEYRDPTTSKFLCTLTFELKLEPGPGGLSVHTFLWINLAPFRITEELHLMLFLGSKDGRLGKFLAVTVCPGQHDAALICVGKREDVLSCVQVLRQGVDLKLLLRGPGETLVDMPVPNNKGFAELYDQAYETVAKSDARSNERKSLFDRIFR